MNSEAVAEYMSAAELAQYLSVSEKAIEKWTQRRRIPVVKVGRLNRYPRREIERRLLNGYLLK